MGQSEASAIAVCKVCGMPVRVVFADDGVPKLVLAPCGHVTMPGLPQASPRRQNVSSNQPKES